MSQTEWAPSWVALAACREGDPDALFVTGAEQHQAKQVCIGCAANLECLADALDNQIEFGVWGGMTERERRALLRRRPDVTSWRDLLLAAQAQQLGKPEVIDMRTRQQRQAQALARTQAQVEASTTAATQQPGHREAAGPIALSGLLRIHPASATDQVPKATPRSAA